MNPKDYQPHTGYESITRAGYYDWCDGRESLSAVYLAAGKLVEYRHYETGWRQAKSEGPHIARRADLGN
jgi:hypothetical protein